MIKVAQFGEGGFLRTFADLYFETLNKEGGDYRVNVIKPIPFGTLDKFRRQNNRYHVILRGMKNGAAAEDVYKVNCIENVIDPFNEYGEFLALARDKDLKIIVSNTTEAGICFNEKDKRGDFEHISYPAKLTEFLYERYKAGCGGVYLMPVELIDDNADNLRSCVSRYVELWEMEQGFKDWNEKNNYYCNTLVDRIVSGYPRDKRTEEHLTALIGEKDELMSVGEPFGLWVVEKKGDIEKYIKSGEHNISVIVTEDIHYYKRRKVRVLNGSHTNMVAAGLWLNKTTVEDCMKDNDILSFFDGTLKDEIIPFVSDNVKATAEFAQSVRERFFNPYLNHMLISISLNSISKWRARVLPSFKDYYAAHGKIPARLTVGFSYLMALYASISKEDGKYYANLPSGKTEFKDDGEYLAYFAANGGIEEFMSNRKVWGEDLGAYNGFTAAVLNNVAAIRRGEKLI